MTNHQFARRHLTLVAGSRLNHTDTSTPTARRKVQLCLPFEDRHIVILLNSTELAATDSFAAFAQQIKPRWLLDVRVAPRMDFIASSRPAALNNLASLGVTYIDILGRTHQASGPLQLVAEILHTTQGSEGPYVILFDDELKLRETKRLVSGLKHELQVYEGLGFLGSQQSLLAL